MNAKTVLGMKVKDRLTGFTGIVTGYVTYISGCNQCLVAPPTKKDGTLAESHWFDEQRLEVLSKQPIVLDNRASSGFDLEAPRR